MADADWIVRGRILTMDPRRATAKALAVAGGRVLAVGTEAQADRWRGKRTRSWRLKDRQTVVPGFVDAHAHLAHDAWRRTWVDLGGCASLEEALNRLRARASNAAPGAWIVARWWDESAWPERRYLTREDLDRVSLLHPILANRVDGHLCSVNSAVLLRVEFGGVDGVERGADGQPTGVLKETAGERARDAVPRPTDAEWAEWLSESIAHVHSLGVTAVHDCVEPAEVRAYQELRRQGKLAFRATLMPYATDALDALAAAGLRTGFGDEWLRLGAIKAFADGSLGARTAALLDPYEDAPGEAGQLTRSAKELAALVGKAHAAGFQIAVHAIGDRAVDEVVEAYGRVLDREPREDHRHRIEHCELPSGEALDRMREMGLVAVMQPNFVARWSGPGGMYEQRLGRARLEGNNPYREILRRRIPLAFGSDGMPYGPLYGLGGAVDAPFASQRIAARDAVRTYTAGGAYAGFSEDEFGTLAAGKLADFVVLSGDPAKGPSGLAVDATVVGGRVVFRRRTRGGTV